MKYKLEDLIDLNIIKHLLDNLNQVFGIASAIVDNESNILLASGWQDICIEFHRKNEISEIECKESDRYLISCIQNNQDSVVYKCPHGMGDAATPIIISGTHIASFIIGQFFIEKPDIDLFKNKAEKYGYDEKKYLEAISRVPIITKEEFEKRLMFVKTMTEIIIKMGEEELRKIEYTETIKENAEKHSMELELKNKELRKILDRSISSLSKISEIRDRYTSGHQKKVQKLACAIGCEMGLSEEQIENISLSALVFDIGKIYVSSDILNKPDKLTHIEYKLIQTHVKHSYDIIKEINFPNEVLNIIYQHHERLDGTGYPEGISGNEIVIESRILAVSDVVDAMCSHRPYRSVLGVEAALQEITQFKGIKYDIDVVNTCVNLFREKGFSF